MTEPRIRFRGLRKRFGRLEVLRGVDLDVPAGRITAIVGPNAAGKSTLIKTLLGLVRLPGSGGTVEVDGDVVNGGPAYRAGIGYMPQAAHFPSNLTGREVIALLKDLRGPGALLDEELIGSLRLEPALDQPVSTLSGGTRQKLNAVVAFLFRPTILVLDEATAGLDPVAAGLLKAKVRAAAAGGATVILTGHILGEIEELADDIVFLIEGTVGFRGTLDELLARSGEANLERALARLLTEAGR
jgi:Cu-processing system ATP-binding protein